MYWKVKQRNGTPTRTWKVLRKCDTYNQMKKQCMNLLVAREIIYQTEELKSLVPVDTETNISLKIVTQKIDVISQSHNVIKDAITLT